MAKRHAAVAAALGAMLVLAGCTSPAASAVEPHDARENPPSIAPSSLQLSELDDGVTEEEYLAAFTRFQTCMDEAGYPLLRVQMNDSLMDYATLAEADFTGDQERCYLGEFQKVDARWQFQHKDESPANRANQACLAAAGVTPKTTTEDVWAQILEAGLDPTKCAREYSPE